MVLGWLDFYDAIGQGPGSSQPPLLGALTTEGFFPSLSSGPFRVTTIKPYKSQARSLLPAF